MVQEEQNGFDAFVNVDGLERAFVQPRKGPELGYQVFHSFRAVAGIANLGVQLLRSGRGFLGHGPVGFRR